MMKYLTISILWILIVNPLIVVDLYSAYYHDTVSNEMNSSNQTISTISTPIVIGSNADFADQGWSGNGNESYPYLIEDLEIQISESDSVCIQISNTSSHFEIRNSIFYSQQSDGRGISLLEVSNGSIVNCTFTNLQSGIFAQFSNSCSFIDCTFKYCGAAVDLVNVTLSTLTENTMLFNVIGSYLYYISECNITDNLIAYNTDYGIILYESSQNCIFNNSIAYNQNEFDRRFDRGENNAVDYGSNNQWDDNITLGNSWSDYSGSGVYNITGNPKSVDRFPRLAHFDFIGPDISGVTNWQVTVMPGPCPFSDLTIHATVRDESGVDSVQIHYGALSNETSTIVEMTHTPSDQNPDLYTFYIEGPFYNFDFIRYYYIWANDTIGHNSTSIMLGNWNQCSTASNFYPFGIMILISAIPLLTVIFLVIRKKIN